MDLPSEEYPSARNCRVSRVQTFSRETSGRRVEEEEVETDYPSRGPSGCPRVHTYVLL